MRTCSPSFRSLLVGVAFGLLAVGAQAQTTVVVKPETLSATPGTDPGWFFYDSTSDTPQLPGSAYGTFSPGPAPAPLQFGSLRLGPMSTNFAALVTLDYAGTKLADITAISYKTYVTSSPNPVFAPSVKFDITWDPATATFYGGTLVFEPYINVPALNSAVQAGTWQTWTISPTAGRWWSSRASHVSRVMPNGPNATAGVPRCGQGNPCTFDEIKAFAPNAIMGVVVSGTPAASKLLIETGSSSGGWTGFDGKVDDLLVTIGGASPSNKRFDFEPNDCFVDASRPDNSGNGLTLGAAKKDIQAAIAQATCNARINVAAGLYNEDVTINKPIGLVGAGSATTTISGPIGGPGATITVGAAAVVIDGFTITRDGNNITDWNNGGLNNGGGIAIQGQTVNAEVRNCLVTGNRTGIDVNNSNGNNIHNNVIDFNRTGLLFRNQTDNTTFVENFVTNNWTVGVLFIDGSGGSNSPLQQALTSTFSNNDISANWYGQIVDRQSGGSLPAPGTLLKNFTGNWYGTTTPVVTTANSTEPGYAGQIPVAYGGAAVPPGGQPDILGPASANFTYSPLLPLGTDTDVETVPGRGTYGFQGVSVPGAPTIGTVAGGNATISVPFTAPAFDGGLAITGYTLTCTGAGGPWTNSGPSSPISVGISNGVPVSCTVHATNSQGSGPESSSAGITVPGIPTGATAVAGSGTVSVSFAAGSTGNSTPVSYTATCAPYPTASGSSSPIVVAVPDGNTVTCTVHASNFVGDSPESVASNSATPSGQTLSVNATSVTEGNSGTKNFNLSITRAGGTLAQTFSWVATAGTAATPEDFGTAMAPCDTAGATCGTATFPAGGAATRTFALPGLINGDTKYELNETFTVAISSAGPIGTAAAVMTITSDDTVVPVVSLSAPLPQMEGTAVMPTSYPFTVTMNRASYQAVTVSLASSPITATTPGDYTIPASVTIPAGDTMAMFNVSVVADNLDEANETFTMTLNTITTSNATFGATITRTGTITDDDNAPTVKISSAGLVTEGGLAVFDINLSAPSGQTVSVKVTTANGTTNPASAADYINPGVQTITFMPGQTYQSHSVQTVDDGNEEQTEYIKATLGTFVNTSLLNSPADGTAEGAIGDDGDVLTVSVDDQADTDAAGTNQVMTFNVTLSGTSWQTVKMNIATADGTATAGSDYTQKVVQNLTFTPGQTAKTFTVTVLADAAVEGMETFQVQALPPTTGPANIVLSPTPFGTGTITDTPTTSGLIISEFRFRGPNGPEDEFIEVKNNTGAPIAILSLPAGPGVGLAVKKSDGTTLFTIPNGTTIRGGAHYLGVNSNGYSLAGYSGAGKAAANVSWIGDVADTGTGIALMNNATMVDAVGFTGAPAGFFEGTPLPAAYDGSVTGQYSHVRKTPVTGPTKDTNDNASDFEFVATYASPADTGVFITGGPAAAVGSPGPENLASPTERGLSAISVTLLDPGVAQSGNPNRSFTSGAYVYNTRSYAGGVMDLRRTITNNTSATITRIRFQALDVTTKNGHSIFTPVQNDVRWINAAAETAVPTTLGPKNTLATTLDVGVGIGDEGGAINSSVTFTVALAPGASINVHLRLAFASATDPFRFVFGVEALPQQ